MMLFFFNALLDAFPYVLACLPEDNQIEAVKRNEAEMKTNVRFVGIREDVVSMAMAGQVCVWDFISIAWQIREMRMR